MFTCVQAMEDTHISDNINLVEQFARSQDECSHVFTQWKMLLSLIISTLLSSLLTVEKSVHMCSRNGRHSNTRTTSTTITTFWTRELSQISLLKTDISSRSKPFLGHNENIYALKNQVITIYEQIIFFDRYYLLKIKFLFDIMFVVIETGSW